MIPTNAPDLNAPILGPMMTPDELRKYAATTTFYTLGRAILHLFAERDALNERCLRLLAGEALALRFKEDAEIQQAHLAAYERENQRLRRLLDVKTPAPWDTLPSNADLDGRL